MATGMTWNKMPRHCICSGTTDACLSLVPCRCPQQCQALSRFLFWPPQPEGPSWEIDGNHVKWQQWDLRVGFNYREGLVLHQIGCACVTAGSASLCLTGAVVAAV